MTTTQTAPGPRRLLEGLLALPAPLRALVGTIEIRSANGHATVSCWSLLDTQTRLAGGSLLAEDVAGQVREVADSGLFGTTTHESATTDTSDTWRLHCWTDQSGRADALRELRNTGESGTALIGALEEQRTANWRATRALAAAGEVPLEAVNLLRGAEDVATTPEHTPVAAPPDPGPPRLVRMKLGHSAPCVVCGLPATEEHTGRAVHKGECLRTLLERDQSPAQDLVEDTASEAPAPEVPEPHKQVPEEPASVVPAAATPAAVETALKQETPPARQATGAVKPTRKSSRFGAPIAVLDAELAHLPGGSSVPWAASHLGELAMLAQELRLGHGGGKSLPDVGQIWLTPAAVERLGLPVVVDGATIGPDEALTRSQASKRIAKAMAKVAKKGAIKDAVDAGWHLGERGLDAWTRLSHPELMPRGVWVVIAPWQRVTSVPLFVPTNGTHLEAAELADRLGRFADLVTTTYELTPPITTLQLIDHTRPPRPEGTPMNTPASVQRTAPELPPFLREERYAQIERDFSWWRTWSSLTETEKSMPYVAGWDRTWSYVAPWSSVYVGVEDLEHHTGDDAQWDGKASSAGYWLIDKWEWPHWGLPDPLSGHATTGFAANNRIWVTTPTLEQLRMVGIHPLVHESWRWHTTARYLDIAGKTITTALQNSQKGDPVHDTIKSMYRAGVSKFAQRDLPRGHHLARRDWRDHIVAATRTQILYRLKEISERAEGKVPLVVSTDAILYASDTNDLVEGWVGDPKRLTPREAGGWKPLKWGELAVWGPQYLIARDGGWPYRDAMNALKEPDDE